MTQPSFPLYKFLQVVQRIEQQLAREDGQDLIEYALIIGVIALGATTGLGFLANALNQAFLHVGAVLTSSY